MKNASLAVLVVAVVLLGGLAWQQSQRIAALEKTAASVAAEREAAVRRATDAEGRLAAAEKTQSELETELKDARKAPAVAPAPAVATTRASANVNAMAALDNPAMQKMMAATFKSSLDQRYGGLFRQLRLSPAELDRLKDLLAERQMSGLDVMRAAQSQGMNLAGDPSGLAKLMSQAQSEVDNSIRSLIGDQRFEQYQDFNQNIGAYSLLDQIERRLSYTNAPLQSTQSEALLRVLVETSPPAETGARGIAANFVQSLAGASPIVGAMAQRPISNETVQRSAAVLSAAQVEVIRQLQAEQQSQAGMMQSLRGVSARGSSGTVTGGNAGAPGAVAPTGGAVPVPTR